MSVDRAALTVGGIRLASGLSFLVDPLRANRLWGDSDEPAPTAGHRPRLGGAVGGIGVGLWGAARPAARRSATRGHP